MASTFMWSQHAQNFAARPRGHQGPPGLRGANAPGKVDDHTDLYRPGPRSAYRGRGCVFGGGARPA